MQKRFFSLLPLAAVATALLFHSSGDPLPLGSPIPNPDIKMKDISGKEVSLSEAKTDKGLLVMFSCNTCPIVKKYQSRTLEVCKHATDNNIGIILLNSNEATRGDGDSYNDMKEYAKEQGYYFNYVLDDNSKMADAFGAMRTPEIFLFDKDGKLAYHGAIDDNSTSPDEVTRKHAILAIDELVSGKEISRKETRSVGCVIKRKG
jgi:thiol-disulfide isomerase/thioredoxin